VGADTAGCLEELGRIPEAIAVQKEVVAGRRRIFGPDDQRTYFAQENMARMLLANGDGAAAEPLIRWALAWCAQNAPGDTKRIDLLRSYLARALALQKKPAEAELPPSKSP
jgi:hypothetical protein